MIVQMHVVDHYSCLYFSLISELKVVVVCAQSAIMNKITTPKRKKNNNKSGSPTRVRMHADRYILNVQKRFLDPLHSGSNVAGVMMLDVPLKKHRPRRHTLLQTTFEMHPKISVCQGIYRNSSAFPRSQDKRVRISKKNLSFSTRFL